MVSVSAAAQDLRGSRVITNRAFYLKDWWVTLLQRDSTLRADSALPTSKAVKEFVEGRIDGLLHNNYVKTPLYQDNDTSKMRQASATDSGWLSKEDWITFRDRVANIRKAGDSLTIQVLINGSWVNVFKLTAGGGSADSSTFYTVFRSDTSRANIYRAIQSISTQGLSDGLISVGGISLLGSTVTISPNIVWAINNTVYTKATSSAFVITAATTGFYRKDLIYADAFGALTLLPGTEDAVIAVAPDLPNNTIEVAVVDIYGSTVTTPAPSTSKSAWAVIGNNISNNDFFGATNNQDLRIRTNNILRLVIPKAGIIRATGSSKKVLLYDTTSRALSYADAGAGSADSVTFQTVYRSDTSRANIYAAIKKNLDSLVSHNLRLINLKDTTVAHNLRLIAHGDTLYNHNQRLINLKDTAVAHNQRLIALENAPGVSGVTDFSAGDLSPLFTTTETNTTSTPALGFSQSNTSQYSLLGRKASGSGVYGFHTADSSLIPDLHSEGYYNTKYIGVASQQWIPNGGDIYRSSKVAINNGGSSTPSLLSLKNDGFSTTGLAIADHPDSSKGVYLANDSAATATRNQWGLPMYWKYQYYISGESRTMQFKIQPIPLGSGFNGLAVYSKKHTGAWTEAARFGDNGTFSAGGTSVLSLSNSGGLVQTGIATFNAGSNLFNTTQAAISTLSAVYQNNAAATIGTPVRYSAATRHAARVWNTTTSVDNYVSFTQEVRPVSGSAPTFKWWLYSTNHIGSNTDRLGVNSSGAVTIPASLSVGTSSDPVASAVAEFTSVTQGALLPRMTKTERDAIASPAQGLLVFVTDNGGYLSWYNSGWQKVSSIAD